MFNKTKILVPALLLSLSCPVVLAQNRQQSASRNGQASEQQQQRRQASLAPWLVTIEHKINIEDLQRSLAKHGIKLSGGTNNQPVNVTTGIIVDNKGHILTRLLNINPNSKSVGSILVSLPSGETRPADFVGVDGLTGFCLLSIQGIDTTPAPIAERPELEMGSEVTFFDIQLSPAKTFRLQSLRPSTRNSDQLSFEARNEQKTGKITAIGSRENFIVKFETDTLQPTSTGFLIRDSKIVGIAESAESNIVRAFSAYQARLAAERILNHRGNVPRGWLGVSGRDLAEFTPEEIEVLSLGSNRGVLINVLPDSPAVAAGLRSGDIVLKIDGQEVNSLQKLASYIGLKTPGKVVEFEILRAKEPLKLNVSVGERPYSPFLLPDKAEQNAQRLHLEQEIA
ncbi:MAG: PDZ domain-containing protein, partial [Blastocatellia bacterium]|nr:PDZ domain-containing protein [Blastocatellia bacterium]